MKRLNLEEIGRRAGVSRSTVSRVVNDEPNVSADAKRRVEAVIAETGYRPHAAAKSLAAFRAKAPAKLKLDAADASLKCAERLLSDGKKLEAMAIYKELMKAEQKHVKVAAQRGLLAAMRAK